MDAGQRPTAALLEEDDPFRGWTTFDYRIQEALNIMEREVCKTCGNPAWLCHSTDNRIQFEVQTGACYAKAEIEEFEERQGDKKLNPGEYHYATPIGVENGTDAEGNTTYDPLPTRREAMKKLV